MCDNGRVYRDYCPTTAPLYPPLVVVQKLRFDMRQVIAACVETFVPREHLDHLDLELSPNWPVRGQFKSRCIACALSLGPGFAFGMGFDFVYGSDAS